MIPKIIHYCWFGRGKFTLEIEKCMASWRKYCPDWEICRWDEDNSPMDIPWIRDAYKMHQYAFVADYVRLYVLYKRGGIYLDTDMLLIHSLDVFLNEQKFIGREDKNYASFGIIGMPPGDEFCKLCLEYYDNSVFDNKHRITINRIITPILEQYGFEHNDVSQTLTNGLTVFCSSYFYPVHYRDTFNVENLFNPPYGGFVKPNVPTYAIHLWNKSWAHEMELFSKKRYKEGFVKVWWRIRQNPKQPIKYYKKVIKYFIKFLLGK